MEKELNKLKDMLGDELKRIIQQGRISPSELDNAMKAVCLMEKIDNLGQGGGGYSSRNYGDYSGHDDGGSYRRGRSQTTGRFMSRDGGGSYEGGSYRGSYEGGSYDNNYDSSHSNHSIKDRMLANLEDMMGTAKSDYERQTIQEMIGRLQS